MLIGLIILFTVIFGFVGQYKLKRNRRYISRVQKYIPKEAKSRDALHIKKRNVFSKYGAVLLVARLLKDKRFIQKWELRLDEAALSITPEEFFVRRFLFGIVGLLIGVIVRFPSIVIILLFVSGYWFPILSVKRNKQKRIAKFSEQLPQVLRTMTTAIKAGFSIVQAIQLVGKEADDPIAYEFTRTIREMNLGVPLEEAFENFAKRVPNDDLKIMITAILIQRTVGGNLADILETVQQTIQDRIKIKQELRTLTAQGRMSAWIITLLPVALALILYMMSPDYFSPMFTHPLGWTMLAGAVCSGVLGWLMIQKMIKIEV